MAVSGYRGANNKTSTDKFQLGPWLVTAVKSHILKSEGPSRQRFEEQLELPQVPEMIFADNVLRLEHEGGFGIEFNALDALKLVDAHHDQLKVAVSDAWKEARADSEHIKEVVKPFDWTYTTDYKGTLIDKEEAKTLVNSTAERIDIDKLKQKDRILFYSDIVLFEDELADNGVSILSVKIRVMPTSFFILMRQFMRVDKVLIRVNDTRIYHEAGEDNILREFTSKDDRIENIQAPPNLFTEPNEISKYLTLRKELVEKIVFSSADNQNIIDSKDVT